ncbi:MAG: hypothetical protein R6W90_04340 [Ignavibacteriaceae bacterium]
MQLDGRSFTGINDKYKFTGKERDNETGYDYFARYGVYPVCGGNLGVSGYGMYSSFSDNSVKINKSLYKSIYKK